MCGPKFCSMELTRQLRDEAAKGMEEKSVEFRKCGESLRPQGGMTARAATADDAAAIAAIYNEGIEDRVATFETRPRTAAEILAWFDGRHPAIVIEENGRVVAFASTSSYRPRECYSGIAEASVYVARDRRGHGYGRAALEALSHAAVDAGFWKLVSRVFPENAASRALLRRTGFREVGIYHRHARLDGAWRDVVIVEKLIGIGEGLPTPR